MPTVESISSDDRYSPTRISWSEEANYVTPQTISDAIVRCIIALQHHRWTFLYVGGTTSPVVDANAKDGRRWKAFESDLANSHDAADVLWRHRGTLDEAADRIFWHLGEPSIREAQSGCPWWYVDGLASGFLKSTANAILRECGGCLGLLDRLLNTTWAMDLRNSLEKCRFAAFPEGRSQWYDSFVEWSYLLPLDNAIQELKQWDARLSTNGETIAMVAQRREEHAETTKKVKSKRSTQPGEAREKLIAALCSHHGFDGDSCSNYDPIGSNALYRLACVAKATSSEFFTRVFGGLEKYKSACGDKTTLITSLKLLRGDVLPKHLLTNRRSLEPPVHSGQRRKGKPQSPNETDNEYL
jgi:hypothetical protein